METTIEQKEAKIIYLSLIKHKIKELSGYQKFLKNQRKTVHFIGSRKIEPKIATAQHILNREELRIQYAVYGILRDKDFSQIENGKTLDDVPIWRFKERVNTLVNKYTYK
jgi:hypothetical protein